MKFEWDEDKNQANIRRHRIDFADVPPVFDGPMVVALDTRKNYGEDRLIGIGLLINSVVVIVFVERTADTIRIISARKADRHEREKFKKEIRN
jgi:uncharacterized DUF497 family protein